MLRASANFTVHGLCTNLCNYTVTRCFFFFFVLIGHKLLPLYLLLKIPSITNTQHVNQLWIVLNHFQKHLNARSKIEPTDTVTDSPLHNVFVQETVDSHWLWSTKQQPGTTNRWLRWTGGPETVQGPWKQRNKCCTESVTCVTIRNLSGASLDLT